MNLRRRQAPAVSAIIAVATAFALNAQRIPDYSGPVVSIVFESKAT